MSVDKNRKTRARGTPECPKKNGLGDSCIVTFRAPTEAVGMLAAKLKSKPIIGVRSVHQYSRKLFLDFIAGRVVYLNPKDAAEDPALAG